MRTSKKKKKLNQTLLLACLHALVPTLRVANWAKTLVVDFKKEEAH